MYIRASSIIDTIIWYLMRQQLYFSFPLDHFKGELRKVKSRIRED